MIGSVLKEPRNKLCPVSSSSGWGRSWQGEGPGRAGAEPFPAGLEVLAKQGLRAAALRGTRQINPSSRALKECAGSRIAR